jgi:hypothetical protein
MSDYNGGYDSSEYSEYDYCERPRRHRRHHHRHNYDSCWNYSY